VGTGTIPVLQFQAQVVAQLLHLGAVIAGGRSALTAPLLEADHRGHTQVLMIAKPGKSLWVVPQFRSPRQLGLIRFDHPGGPGRYRDAES